MSDHNDGLDDDFEVDVGDLEAEAQTEAPTEESQDTTEESSGGYVETDDPKIKARLGQLTREKWEAARAREKAERELQQLRSELQSLKAPRPVEPPSADLAIDDPVQFRQQQEQYAAYVKQQAVHENEKRRTEAHLAEQQKAQIERDVLEYTKRAAELKISADELRVAGDIVGNSGIAQEVVSYLLTHESGPAIVKQLAARPDDLYSIAAMPAYKATAQIERMFSGQKKPQNNPPPPPPTKVNGIRATGTRAADGTIYE